MIGWTHRLQGSLFLKRDWDKDQGPLLAKLSDMEHNRFPRYVTRQPTLHSTPLYSSSLLHHFALLFIAITLSVFCSSCMTMINRPFW
jgi:hypothetical protein